MTNENSVTEVILHCQKQIKKNSGEEKLLHYLARLRRLRIKVKDLVDTGIGRTVNQLSRQDGIVGQQASDLVAEWKAVVEAEKSTSEGSESDSTSHDDGDEDDEEPEEEAEDKDALHICNDNDKDNDDEDEEGKVETNFNKYDKKEIKSYRHSESHNHKHNGKDRNKHDYHSSSSKRRIDEELIKPESETIKVKLESKDDNDVQKKRQLVPTLSVEIDSTSGFNFADVLTGLDQKSSTSSSSTKKKDNIKVNGHDKAAGIGRQQASDFANGWKANIKVEKSASESSNSTSHDEDDDMVNFNEVEEEESEDEEAPPISKDKDKRKVESKYSKNDKEEVEKNHRHSHSHSHSHNHNHNGKHRHKDDGHSRSKRKNDEELVKPKTEIKKVKLEQKDDKSKKRQLVPTLSVEIDSTSGFNFADVLTGLDQKMSISSSSSKKKDKPKVNDHSHDKAAGKPISHSHGSGSLTLALPSSSKSKRTAHEDKHKISSSSSKYISSKDSVKSKSVILPTTSLSSYAMISPHYKPSAVSRIMAVAPMPVSKPYLPKEIFNSLQRDFQGASGYPLQEGENRLDTVRRTNEDALSTMISSRNQRTKVYSGVKAGCFGTVPKLFDLCIRTIQENVNDLGYTGGVPYDILKPVLDRTTADQLFHLENYNPYLIDNTDELWKFHCGKDFRGKLPQELESWRDLYIRSVDERKARLHTLTNKVKTKQETAIPQMKAKLAYVDTTAGPKFSRTKTETIRNGMKTLKTREEKGVKRTHGSSASAGGIGSTQNVSIEEASIIISPNSKAGSAPASSRERESYSSAASKKPKKAPLMQKTLKVIKTLFRR